MWSGLCETQLVLSRWTNRWSRWVQSERTQLWCVITPPQDPADRSDSRSSLAGGSGYKMLKIRSECHSSADSADPLWSSGSRQFNSTEPTFVKCLGPLDQSEGTVTWTSPAVRLPSGLWGHGTLDSENSGLWGLWTLRTLDSGLWRLWTLDSAGLQLFVLMWIRSSGGLRWVCWNSLWLLNTLFSL